MARNNLTWIKGDITGDIYFDHVHLEGKEVQFLRLILMIKGVIGAARGVHARRDVCISLLKKFVVLNLSSQG